MRWSSRLGDPQAGLPLVHHSGGLNLSVPWMKPGPLPNGQQEPAASAASHGEIDALIEDAAHSSKTAHFVDDSPYITASGQYETELMAENAGSIALHPDRCTTFKPSAERPYKGGVLSMIRQALADRSHRQN